MEAETSKSTPRWAVIIAGIVLSVVAAVVIVLGLILAGMIAAQVWEALTIGWEIGNG